MPHFANHITLIMIINGHENVEAEPIREDRKRSNYLGIQN